MLAQAPEAVTAAWDQVVAHWGEPKRHEALLGLVASYNCYAWVAGRYRERAGDPIAEQQLERIRKAATIAMFATASKRPDETRKAGSIAVLVVLLIVCVVGGVLLYGKLHAHAT
ncbi:hypothetical protein BH11MYX1_BH11MYX1_45140 [soil metagenome]